MPLVSVVVVNYNGKGFLEKCLSSLSSQSYPDIEIIFVDNGSSDGSTEYVRKEFQDVKILEIKKNLGFAKGNNIGIKVARGELIATLNNDTQVTSRWLEELVWAMKTDPDIGMCASKMLFMEKPDMIQSTGLAISRSGVCWDRGIYETDNGQYGSVEEIFGPCAGAALYRKKMLEEIGLFDEDFHAYLEDTDLAFRGRLSGWKCVYVPKAVVYHYHGGTAGFETEYTIYYANRNILWNTIKNFPFWVLMSSLPWIIGRNIAVLPYYFIKGHGKAIFRSKIDAIKGIPKMIARRSRSHVHEKDIRKFIQTWAPARQHMSKEGKLK
ncbi:MAG: glycosyltransferase family 2 protein [Euryarchaeota archaeon]|nr:glycosyltransferase family 2 protein [Euryarchaeota archaeon]MBU4139221.1 glycosyltransferase family 2 protein [Euryarchaeota archaeon]